MFLSLVGLSLLISQGIFAKLFVQVIGETATILVGFAFAVLHYVVYAFADRAWIVYMGLFFGCVSFVGDPALKGLIARQVPVSEQGALQGALSGLTTLLRPFSPLFGTTIFGYANSMGRPGIVFGAISVLSSFSLLVVSRALYKPGMK
jgi:MFS transporter, DHA1 family, tetracycline resistance protein